MNDASFSYLCEAIVKLALALIVLFMKTVACIYSRILKIRNVDLLRRFLGNTVLN